MKQIRIFVFITVILFAIHSTVVLAKADVTFWRFASSTDPNCDVTFYGDPDGEGWIANLYIGDTALLVSELGFPNDDLSCIEIHNKNAIVILYPHEYYEDYYLALGSVMLWNLEGFGFDDICSSFYICCQGEQWPNFMPENQFQYDEYESTEMNNIMAEDQESLPDLAASEIICLNNTKSQLAVGSTINFDASVINLTQTNTGTGFNIKWFVDGVIMGYGYHEGVAGNTEIFDGNSQFSFIPTLKGVYLITFFVDCDNHIEEQHEANNVTFIYVTID